MPAGWPVCRPTDIGAGVAGRVQLVQDFCISQTGVKISVGVEVEADHVEESGDGESAGHVESEGW